MAICGGIVLEEVLNLSSDRLLDDDDDDDDDDTCIYVENTEIVPKTAECEILDWIYLKYERHEWRALINKVFNLWFP